MMCRISSTNLLHRALTKVFNRAMIGEEITMWVMLVEGTIMLVMGTMLHGISREVRMLLPEIV